MIISETLTALFILRTGRLSLPRPSRSLTGYASTARASQEPPHLPRGGRKQSLHRLRECPAREGPSLLVDAPIAPRQEVAVEEVLIPCHTVAAMIEKTSQRKTIRQLSLQRNSSNHMAIISALSIH